MPEKNQITPSTLYLVATPIGNLADLSARAIKVLSEVDFIAAEDTRNTGHLLSYLGIQRPLVSYHEHNKRERGEQICDRLAAGESCALVTDAGMPAISDPGEDIVKLCAEYGITVSVIPGPCAAVSALALSGLATSRFAFEGFLPAKKCERTKRLAALLREERTMIFYEAPHKLSATIKDMCEVLGGDRKISLCRELTKINEEIIRTTLSSAEKIYSETEPRGEFVLILEGAEFEAPTEENPLLSLSPTEHTEHYIKSGMAKMDAIKKAAKDRGISKSEMYKMLLDDENS